MAPSSQQLFALFALGLLCTPQQVNAHGYITTPPSRQASCANGDVEEANCGGVTYEPQSVETEKGAPFQKDVGDQLCNGGGARFAAMNNVGEGMWPHTSIPASEDLNVEWKITAAHKTESWAYYITKPGLELDPSKAITAGDFQEEPILMLDTDHDAPPATLSHTIPADSLANHSGYAVIYGVWSIGDTGNAFYNCLDVNIENDSASEEPPTSTSSSSETATPTSSAAATGTGTKATGTAVSGTAAATGSMSTSTGSASVGYDPNSNSTVLTLSGRKIKRTFWA
ncbi:hypothetical protein Q7P37_002446 [Cladosporium fusiforme]